MNYAICNETFDGWAHDRVCGFIAELGYAGLEIAPFTLAPLITDVQPLQRRELRAQAEAEGIHILGLHWLLAKTNGFQLISPVEEVRNATADYLGELARCAADLGGDILVLGSPKQRNVPAGFTVDRACDFAVDVLERVLPVLDETGVSLCLEPLTPHETDFMNTAADAVAIIERLGHPLLRLHLDVKAMTAEPQSAAETIRKYPAHLKHFHANDPNLRGPGFGDTDFVPIFAALKAIDYSGYVSVEVFDYSPDPETIARESLAYMMRCE